MKSSPRTVVFATLLLSVALSSAYGGRAFAAGALPDSANRIHPRAAVADRAALRLGLAGMERRRGNTRGVVEALEGLDFTHGPSFSGADRAAFLLAQAYRQLGDRAGLEALATIVQGWQAQTTYTRLIEFERRFGDNASPSRTADDTAADDGTPLGLLAGAQRVANSENDDPARWVALVSADTLSALGRDLSGAALVHLAARAFSKGEDARPWLERVPAGCRYESRAMHLRGLAELEAGRPAEGTRWLVLALADSTYGARREVLLALAGVAMESGDWNGAHAYYEQADDEWAAQRAGLLRLKGASSLDDVWAAWQASPDSSGVLVVDAEAGHWLATRYADASADLVASWNAVKPLPGLPKREGALPFPVLPPTLEDWNTVAASARAVAAVRSERERTRWAADRERETLADGRRYLGLGLDGARASVREWSPRLARLDSLRHAIDSLDARLRWLRDTETRRLTARLNAIGEDALRQATWMQGMHQLYVCGPDSALQQGPRNGLSGPARALSTEQALNARLRADALRMLETTPGVLAHSYDKAWGPGLIDRVVAQAEEAGRDVRWAKSLAASLDSNIAANLTSGTLERLSSRFVSLGKTADSLAAADAALRTKIARDAVARTLAAIEREREPLDYGLAASSYALAVRLSPRDSAFAPVVLAGDLAPAKSADSTSAPASLAEESEDPEALRWRNLALPALQAFLAAHPKSAARAEVRFRLADLELLAARQAFREQMAKFLHPASGEAAHGAVPVLDPRRALALYRQMLSEDPGFEHLDAVRFNAGMILADAGDPEAQKFFRDLVTLDPSSAYGQEAWLRMGDLAFNDKRFSESAGMYSHASQGADATLGVMANYKMGWAQFNQDHFLPAADAFRSVLDLYGAHRGQIGVDIEGEAEAYLVHSLAGAGGASAFGPYFDRVGPRPYEKRVLMALGQHFRRYGKFSEAAAADELVLSRFADQPEALVALQRLVETHGRSNHPALVRAARATYADRFAPGGSWYVAQTSDSARAAGAAFSRSSYLAEAVEHHEKAREGNSADEWRETLHGYEVMLAHWPDDPDAARFNMGAGEAGLKLGDYPVALAHYASAERAGRDSIVTLAQLQRVAATDAWYESTRSHAGPGSDSLAHAVLDAGDAFLARSPDHVRSADITWRESQLAIAHNWNERAVSDLERMATRYSADPRAPLAASQRGDALFRMERFEEAGTAFEAAEASARAQGRDSLARRAAAAIPVCAYRNAEAAVAADSTRYARHAAMFEAVATRWPGYVLSPRALYRAGLEYGQARQFRESVRALQALLQRYPGCEFSNDARLQVAKAWDDMGEREQAAQAYLEFSRHDTDHESAALAWLKAAELMSAAGRESRADTLRLEYLRRYPNDIESAMQITEVFARRDVAGVGPGHPVSALLAVNRKGAHASAPLSHLADYLLRAKAHPAMASRNLIAQVRFLQGEESNDAFAALRLSQPLAKSVPPKKRLLDTLLVRYRRSADLGVPEWAHASAYRMGRALEDFAVALEHSDPPADLAGDDLRAYQNVLADRARVFSSRGEDVWTDLLRHQPADGPSDTWLDQTRSALSQRLAYRFLFRPEVEFPVVKSRDAASDGSSSGDSRDSGRVSPAAPGSPHTVGPRDKEPR